MVGARVGHHLALHHRLMVVLVVVVGTQVIDIAHNALIKQVGEWGGQALCNQGIKLRGEGRRKMWGGVNNEVARS